MCFKKNITQNQEEGAFDNYVVKSLLANNLFEITEVHNLESLNSRFFEREKYPEIEAMIKEKNIEALKSLPSNKSEDGQYLDIMMFKDQNQREYIVTVYDSNALEQDPQVIEIYLLK